MSEREPSEEELRAALEEQMRRLTVQDVLVQSVVTLVNLGGRRLGLAEGGEGKDLEQGRLAIEAVRALLPLVPEETAPPIKDALAQLQMTFARESQAPDAGAQPAAGGEDAPEGEGGSERPEGGDPEAERRRAAEEAERAKARSKLWTPPGS